MSTARISLARVLVLKAEAKELVQREHIKHTAALARLSQREGYRSWQHLLATAGGSAALREILGPSAAKIERQRRYRVGGNPRDEEQTS